jgi:two-component system sensor histidine kinase KdpD
MQVKHNMLNKITTLSASIELLSTWQKITLSVMVCGLSATLMDPLIGHLDLANIVMLFLLVVLFVSVTLGRVGAIVAAVVSVLLFDVLFVPPRFSLSVDNSQYLVTFAVMLITGLISGQMSAGLKDKERQALQREIRTRALYETASKLAGAIAVSQVKEICEIFFHEELAVSAAILIANDGVIDFELPNNQAPFPLERHLVDNAIRSGKTINNEAIATTRYASIYVPLKASAAIRGVLALSQHGRPTQLNADDLSLAQTLGAVLAITIERLHYVEVASQADLDRVSERLRATILSALSHDLKTPLTVIMGLAESLGRGSSAPAATAVNVSRDIYTNALRLKTMVNNLLDIVRLEQGRMALGLEWHSLEEVVGAGIQYLGQSLTANHAVRVHIAPDFPLLEMDAILMERVFSNLLENAAKFSPAGSLIEIEATLQGGSAHITISDQGPGFLAADRVTAFERYNRGALAHMQEGLGMGLSICQMIINAHGGDIHLDNHAQGGACVQVVLPLGNAPQVPQES